MCGWFHTRGTWGVDFITGVLEVFYAIVSAPGKILYLKL